jgi:hypothetical protein
LTVSRATSTIGFTAAGIGIAGGTTGPNLIVNNMISGVISPATSPDIVAGIFVAGVTGASTRVDFNSISLTGDRGAVASQIGSFGIAITGTNPTVELKDNIFFTTQTSGGGADAKSFVVGMVSTTFTNLDSNFKRLLLQRGERARVPNGRPGHNRHRLDHAPRLGRRPSAMMPTR